MKMHNLLKEKLEEKKYLVGAFVASCAPQNVEILAMNGMDFAILDMEHSPLGLETMVDMIRAAECYGMVAFPRVYTIETKLMRRVLDVGAHGIMLPMVNTPEEAKYAGRAGALILIISGKPMTHSSRSSRSRRNSPWTISKRSQSWKAPMYSLSAPATFPWTWAIPVT